MRIRHLMTAAWCLVVALATLESAARLDDWVRHDAPLFESYRFDRLFRITGEGVRGVPNARYLRWELNADGLKGPVPTDNGKRRMVVYGASEPFGMYEEPGREFPRVLDELLPGVMVINASLPGMRVGSGIGMVRELARRYQPEVLVIYPTPTHYIGETRPFCGRAPALPKGAGERRLTSRALGKLKERAKEHLPPAVMTTLREAAIAWHTRGRDVLPRVDDASLAALGADIECALATARGLNQVPLLVTHANRFGMQGSADDPRHRPWLTAWRLQYPVLEEAGFIDLENRANDVVRALAARHGVMLVDAAAALGGQEAYFADHAHLSDAGAMAMAELLAPAARDALAASPHAVPGFPHRRAAGG